MGTVTVHRIFSCRPQTVLFSGTLSRLPTGHPLLERMLRFLTVDLISQYSLCITPSVMINVKIFFLSKAFLSVS